MKNYIKLIQGYSEANYKKMFREPQGFLKHPFIVPGSASYNNVLWDWDSWFTNIAIRQIMADNNDNNLDFVKYEKGCILNYLEYRKEDGKIPIFITEDTIFPDIKDTKKTNIHKPCLAQHVAFIIRENQDDVEWIRPLFHELESFVHYYMSQQKHEKTGLYFWVDDMAIGVDNDPSTFYRPKESSASIYLNCLMYRELLAMVYICNQLGKPAEEYKREAASLKLAVNELLWDERNGMYYSADLNLQPINPDSWLHSGRPRHWECLIQRVDCWAGFMAMWAGISTEEQAKRMVLENILKQNLFCAEYGVRTLAKTEKMYCVVPSGNPSCWLGPVWGISNYLCYRGLMNYGFCDEARELACKTIKLFGMDIEKCGEMHEYYDPDTGEGVINAGFQNWNLLVNNMIAEIEGRTIIKEF